MSKTNIDEEAIPLLVLYVSTLSLNHLPLHSLKSLNAGTFVPLLKWAYCFQNWTRIAKYSFTKKKKKKVATGNVQANVKN